MFFFSRCKTFPNFCEICMHACMYTVWRGIDISCAEISTFWTVRWRVARARLSGDRSRWRGGRAEGWLNAPATTLISSFRTFFFRGWNAISPWRRKREAFDISKLFPRRISSHPRQRKPLENQTVWLSFRLLTINRSFPPLINTSRSIFPSTLKLLDNWSLSLSLFLWTRVHYSLAKFPPPFSVQKFLFRNGNSRFSRCHAMEFRQSNVRRMKEWKKKEGERERKKRIDGFYRILERRRRRRRRGLPPN